MQIANLLDQASDLLFRGRLWLREQVEGNPDDYTPSPTLAMQQIINQAGLSALLPYRAYDSEMGLFYNKDSVGFVLEAMPQTGADDKMAKDLAALYTLFPPDSGIQTLCFGSPNLDDTFAQYLALRTAHHPDDPDNTYVRLAQKRVDYLRRGAGRPLWDGSNYSLKNVRVIFSVVRSGRSDDPALLTQLKTQRDAMLQTLLSAKLPSVAWDADDLVGFLDEILNPTKMFDGSPRQRAQYDDGKYISDQVVEKNTVCRPRLTHLRFGVPSVQEQVAVSTLLVKSYPGRFKLHQGVNLIGHLLNNALQFPYPFLFVQGAYTLDYQSTKNRASIKALRAHQGAKSDLAAIQHSLGDQNQEWQKVLSRLDSGEGMCELTHQIVLFAPADQITMAEMQAEAIFRAENLSLTKAWFLQLPTLYTSLPMTLTPGARDDLKTLKCISTKTTGNAAAFSPVFSDWSGYGDPLLLLWGRRGNPANLNPFKNKSGNFNVSVSGVSGSGKTQLANDAIVSCLSIGAKVFTIDIGHGYEKINAALGGVFLDFNPKNPISINPFTHVTNIVEDMKMLKPTAAKIASPNVPLTQYEISRLEEGIRWAWDEKGNDAEFTDVQTYLVSRCKDHRNNACEISYRLGKQMNSFCRGGMYEDFMCGPATINLNNDFVSLEMEHLSGDRHLLSVVMNIMLFQLTYDMYLSRDRPKVALWDEMWKFMKEGEDQTSDTSEVIEEGYRRARRYFGGFWGLSQGIHDWFGSRTAMAAYTNSDCKVYLRQDMDKVMDLVNKGQLQLPPSMLSLLSDLTMVEGKYSEMIVRSPMGSGVLRHIPDPFMLLLASSKAEDFSEQMALRKKGYSVMDAIEYMAYRRGGGRRAA